MLGLADVWHVLNWLAPLAFIAGAMTLWAALTQRRRVAKQGNRAKGKKNLKKLFFVQLATAIGTAVLAWWLWGAEGTIAYWLLVCGACAAMQAVWEKG